MERFFPMQISRSANKWVHPFWKAIRSSVFPKRPWLSSLEQQTHHIGTWEESRERIYLWNERHNLQQAIQNKEKSDSLPFFRDIAIRNGKIKRILSGSSRIITSLLPIRKKPYIKDGARKLEVFQGSSWWCITWDCMTYIASQFNNEKINKYFKTSFAPDEMRIQTIVFNSRYAQNAILYRGEYPGLVGLTPLHTIHYDGAIKIYTEKDYDDLKDKDRMFFRKSVSGIFDKLLDMIDLDRKC